MEQLKILNGEQDNKSIDFYQVSNRRHINFNKILKNHFTIPLDHITKVNSISNSKNQENGNNN